MSPRANHYLLIIRDKNEHIVEAFDIGFNMLNHSECEKLSRLLAGTGWIIQHQEIASGTQVDFDTVFSKLFDRRKSL